MLPGLKLGCCLIITGLQEMANMNHESYWHPNIYWEHELQPYAAFIALL